MRHKVARIKIKAVGAEGGLEEGQFLGYASVFDNVDLYGDVVRKGAFTRTLKEWAARAESAVIPLLYGHDTKDPNNNIGHIVEAAEDDHGLLVKGQIDLEGGNGPQVYRLVKGRRLSEMSFAYDVEDGGFQKEGDLEFYELRDLDLFECSLVPIGANRETELLAVKDLAAQVDRWAVATKAGRVISAKNEGVLKEAQALIADAANRLAEVLSAVADSEEEKASDTKPVKTAEEPCGAKAAEEPAAMSSVDAFLAAIDAELDYLG